MRLPYWLKNLPNRLRGIPQEVYRIGNLKMVSELRAVHIAADGTRTDLGVLGRRVITTAGVNYLATCFTNTVEPEAMNYHESGTGIVAEAIGDTALGTTSGVARVAGTQTTPGSTNIYQTAATVSFVSTLAITEHGIFSASSAGTLLDRTKFSAINVVSGDSIAFTYQMTLPSGG